MLAMAFGESDSACLSQANLDFCAPSQCFVRIRAAHVITIWYGKASKINKKRYNYVAKNALLFVCDF